MIPTFLLKLLTGNPLLLLWIAGGIFVAGLTAGAGGAWTIQGWRLDSARADLRECNTRVAVLGDKLKQQNDAVQQWQDAATKAAQNARHATKQARAVAESHSALVAALEGRIQAAGAAPKGGQGPIQVLGCQDALGELRAAIR